MPESKHTPGPWIARPPSGWPDARTGGRFVILAERTGQCDFFVAEQRHPMVTADAEAQSAANASLIAAAPEMLAALRAIVMASRVTAPPGEIMAICQAHALAAIATAEGRPRDTVDQALLRVAEMIDRHVDGVMAQPGAEGRADD